MYENFNAPSTESLDSIFNMLQKIVSQLAILGENISQEDLNMKFLRSLPSEWNTHVVVWGNKVDLDTMSIDDLYNNFKIIEQEVKSTVASSSSSGSQNMAFLLSPGSTNEVDTANIHISTVSTPVSTVSSHDNTTNLSDATVFEVVVSFAEHESKKVLLANCSRKTVNVEDTSSKAMVAIDEAGFDWSYMAHDEVPTNMALMAFSNSEIVQKPVLKNVEKGMVQREVRPVWNNAMRTNHQNFSNSRRNFAPIIVLTKSGIVPISTARHSSSRAAAPVSAARPLNTAASKPLVIDAKPKHALQTLHSLSRRPFYQQTSLKNKILNNNVNTAKANSINTTKRNKVTVLLEIKGLMLLSPQHAGFGDLKLKYKIMPLKIVDHTFSAPQDALKDQGYFDSGCSKHMTGNISYLTNFKEHDGRYVSFRGGAKGGKITGKGTIRTRKLDFEDVYFVKELQFNLFSVSQIMAKTPRQNEVAGRRNRTLIEAERTMLVESNLPITFWAEVVNTACYVQNRVLVVKPHFKTPYELFKGRSPALSFMRPFGCHVTILNTLDQLGKFDGKSNERIFVGYSTISKAFKVYNIRTRKVEENLHITFLENKPMITGGGPKWLFDIDVLSKLMNYAPVPAGTNSNDFAGKEASFDAGQSSMETEPSQDYIL
nr:retrovirus-related Pol polyprotein from transposon TNT 1-94 [Tanacetum cinerariifolium]